MAFLIELREQFCARFTDTRAYKKCFKLFGAPFSMAVNEAPKSVQMELIDLQGDDLLKAKFDDLMQKTYQKNNVLIEFYQGLLQSAVACPNLLDHAKKMACMFGSTYVCEKLFSKMKYTKNKHRARLTDEHLNDCLLLASSEMKPNYKIISKDKQHHPSH